MKNFTRAWLCLLVSFFSLSLAYGQQQMVFNSIQEKAAIANQLTEVNPFQESSFKSSNPAAIPATLTEAKTLSFEPKILDAVLRNNPAVFELSVPSPYGTLQLLLEPAELFASGFTVNSSDGVKDHDIKLGQFYRGVVKGDDNSLVSLSFINGEVQGMIATQDANLTLGKLKQEKSAQPVYIIYNEKQVETSFPNFCSTQDLPNQKLKIEPVPQGQKSLSNCVTVYFELDYDVFQNKGSVTAATNYIAAVFNEVATLYANESINVKISEVFVWNTSSPYSGTSSTTNLNQFRSTRPNFNGDIGHLIDLRPNNGGIAYVDVICNSNYNYAYSGIYSYYSNVPTYSWTVEVITHEIGHNLGSPHTHSCSWPGGPIDNCYQPDGVCTPGPAPQNGGTIMSYCHLTSHGINFNNGFGPLPGDLIRNRVSNASCLDVCDDPAVCSVPTAINASNITTTSMNITWNAVSSAQSYSIRYRVQGNSTWTTASASSNSYALNNLTPLTTYEVQVRSNCSAENSAYSATQNFTTLSDQVSYCTSQGNDASYEWIAQVKVGSFTKNSGSAQYSNFTADVISIKQGESKSLSLSPGFSGSTYNEYWKIWADLNGDGDFTDAGEELFNSGGLSSSTVTGTLTVPANAPLGQTRLRVSMKYNGQQTSCESFSYGEVEDYTLEVLEDVPEPCNTPSNLNITSSTQSSISLSWSAAGTNETGYTLDYRSQGSSTWTSLSVSGTSRTVSGLSHSTSYEFRVRATCGSENSAYSAIVTGSTVTPDPCNSPNNFSITGSTETSISLSWSAAGSNETSYTLDYRAQGSSTWTSVSVSGTSRTISGLTHSTSYEFRVRATCGSENSPYSAVITGSTATPAPCNSPGNLQSSAITSNSFTASWSAVSGANSYDLQYRAQGSSSWTTVNTTSTSRNISGLSQSTTYEFRVRSNCQFASSAYSAISTATTSSAPITYCASRGNNTSDEWIQSINIAGTSNNSGNNGGYANFTNQTISVTAGNSYSISLSPGFAGGGLFGPSSYPEYWRIWIDYNKDGDFTDAGELVFDAGSTSTTTVNGNISIPSSQAATTTRMRVSMKYNGAPSSCETFGYGEVEDYTVQIQENVPQPCNTPTGLASTGKTDTQISVSWNAVGNAVSYKLEYRQGSSGSFTALTVTGTSRTVTGLQASTAYQFRVSTNCSGESSSPSGTITITTEDEAPEPVNYCTSRGNNSSDEWIKKITIGSFSNNSGNNGGYGNFTNQSLTLAPGSSNSILLEPGFSSGLFGSNSYPEYWKIWIDLNRDGDFTDSGELVFDAGSTSSSNVSGTLVIPSSASPGATRMRVSMKYNGAQSSCESFAYGEVEDYTVNIAASLAGMQQAQSTESWEMSLAPNPVIGSARVLISGLDLDAKLSLAVYDTQGKLVSSQELSNSPELKLDASAFEPGIYILKVTDEKGETRVTRFSKK